MSDFGFASVPAISMLCLLLAQLFKLAVNEESHRHIPVFCGAAGAVLGVLCYFFCPGYIPAENFIVAAVVGVVSGWAATGLHQVYKQYKE